MYLFALVLSYTVTWQCKMDSVKQMTKQMTKLAVANAVSLTIKINKNKKNNKNKKCIRNDDSIFTNQNICF